MNTLVRLKELNIEGWKSTKRPTDTADRKILGELEKKGLQQQLSTIIETTGICKAMKEVPPKVQKAHRLGGTFVCK
jgi:hypothetical protein